MDNGKLVKTRQFTDPIYVGDPVNVISIFNDLEVDEIVILDVARARQTVPNNERDYLQEIATECFVPLAIGGGIKSAEEAERIISVGVEKVIFNSLIIENPNEVSLAVKSLGSQAVVASLDVRGTYGNYEIWINGGTKKVDLTVESWCQLVSEIGVGEIIVTNIDREGTREGIDLSLVETITSKVNVPVIAHGGAGSRSDLAKAILESGASATAAGSLFVFQGDRESVLINYPTRNQIEELITSSNESPIVGSDNSQYQHFGLEEVDTSNIQFGELCSRCIISKDVPGSSFDEEGVCFYCHLHDQLDSQYEIGPNGDAAFNKFIEEIKRAGKGKKYDCIMGVSGGTDSSYLAHVLVQRGVRPLAVHFDNTWNSPTATSNIYAVLDKLNIDLETYVVDNLEYDDIYLSFLKSGVKDIEAPTDIGFMGVLYRAAEAHGIKHIVEGHSFRTEGVSPMGWLYMDGGYIKGVQKLFGTKPLKTYPNMDFFHFLKWSLFSGIQRTRPLYWIDYNKEDAKKFLSDEYGWEWYGGHHLENRFTAFYHSYFLPKRFGINFRQIELSALVRSGQLDREIALRQFAAPRKADSELIALVKKRLNLSDADFDQYMTMPKHTYREYPTYKKRFEFLRPLFWILLKMNRVPESFYIKFCKLK